MIWEGGAEQGCGESRERRAVVVSTTRLPGRGLRAASAGVLQASPGSGGRAAPWALGEAAQDAEKPCADRAARGFRSRALGRFAESRIPRSCSHARPGVPPSGRGSRSRERQPRPRAQGLWRLSARGDTHTHTHTPPRGATAGGGEYWFRYRGRAAPRPRARAGAPTLTKHLFGDRRQGGAEKCHGSGPAVRSGLRRPRDRAPRPKSGM